MSALDFLFCVFLMFLHLAGQDKNSFFCREILSHIPADKEGTVLLGRETFSLSFLPN